MLGIILGSEMKEKNSPDLNEHYACWATEGNNHNWKQSMPHWGWKHGTWELEVNSAKHLMGQKKALKGNPKDEIWRTSYVLTSGGEK